MAREEWHGHVTALSVAPEFRRLGLAAKLMEMLEEISERWVALQRFFVVDMMLCRSVAQHKKDNTQTFEVA